MSREEHETRNDKYRLRGGYAVVIDMESAARVCLRDDAGDRQYIIGRSRVGLCDADYFCNRQCQRKINARFGGLCFGIDPAGDLL